MMTCKYSISKTGFLAVLLLFTVNKVSGQVSSMYQNMPVGKYTVGFKIVTLTDSNRISKPEYNYLGEKNEGDRSRKITVHLWYPSNNNSVDRRVNYGDYCYHHLLTTTNEPLSEGKKNEQINLWRNNLERFFGKASDGKWNELINTPMLAVEDAAALQDKFPLLIGFMRPFTTAITNEFLASHGYLVAMIKKEEPGNDDWAKNARYEIPDMQFVISYLARERNFERNNIGTFGFSGAGFVPVLFAMHDSRVKALADIESLMYLNIDSLFQLFSASDYYTPSNLRVPFLHIFSRESSKLEKFIGEFENKTKFSKRYRLLLDQPGFTHGDFTMQGYALCALLKTRGANQENIRKSFELSNIYLLNFFNAELKADIQAKNFLSAKPLLPSYESSLWSIRILNPVKPAPGKDEFEHIIRKKGIREALAIATSTIGNDSSSNILEGAVLNNLGYTFLTEKKYEEAVGIFKLNIEWHPNEPNLFDSLAEGYEASGDKTGMRNASEAVVNIISKKTTLTNTEKVLKEIAEKRLKQ